MGTTLTNFVYFTMAMYGFFGVGMLSDAKFFFAAESPLCYFTAFDVSAEWFAKSSGTIIFFMLMSPFFAGVSYETLARILLPINLLQLPIFIQGAFFSTTTGPDGCTSPYAMPFNLWIPQVALGVAMLVWNVMALNEAVNEAGSNHGPFSMIRAGNGGAISCCRMVAPNFRLGSWVTVGSCTDICLTRVYVVTFGSTLMIAPKFFWGPDSIFCYWEVNDESGVFFGRILGILMCCVYLAPLCEWARIEPALFRYPACRFPPPEHAPPIGRCRPRVRQAREDGDADEHALPLLLRQGRLLHGEHRPGPQRAAPGQPVGAPDSHRHRLPSLEHQGSPRDQERRAPLLEGSPRGRAPVVEVVVLPGPMVPSASQLRGAAEGDFSHTTPVSVSHVDFTPPSNHIRKISVENGVEIENC